MSILEASVNRLAREISGSTTVFHYYSIDYSIESDNDQKTLKQAIIEAQLSQQTGSNQQKSFAQAEVLAALLPLMPDPVEQKNWEEASTSEIITHVLTRYHQVHRVQLPQLVSLARHVEIYHQDHAQCPHGLAQHLSEMADELEAHMQKEEKILFPMLESDQGHLALGPIYVMRAEHVEHTQGIVRLNQLTHGISLPDDADSMEGDDMYIDSTDFSDVNVESDHLNDVQAHTAQPQSTAPKLTTHTHSYQYWRSLYLGLAIFIEDLQQHINLENNILFARYTLPTEDCYASVL